MPFVSKRAKLEVPAEEMDYLIQNNLTPLPVIGKETKSKPVTNCI